MLNSKLTVMILSVVLLLGTSLMTMVSSSCHPVNHEAERPPAERPPAEEPPAEEPGAPMPPGTCPEEYGRESDVKAYYNGCKITQHQQNLECFTASKCPKDCAENDGSKYDVGSEWVRHTDTGPYECVCTRDKQADYFFDIPRLYGIDYPAFTRCHLLGCRGFQQEFVEPNSSYTKNGVTCQCKEGPDPQIADGPRALFHLSCKPPEP